jgi:hypothetical protein
VGAQPDEVLERLILAVALLTVCPTWAQKTATKPPASGKASTAELPYTGTWVGTYSSNQSAATKITLMIQQFGTAGTGTYLIPAVSAQGVIYGKIETDGSGKFDVDQKTAACPGHFIMEAKIKGNQMTFTFKGSHCGGQENGSGKVTRGR